MKTLLLFLALTTPCFATTWYVRADGGTRYSVNQTSGQCNGTADVAYPGSGVNQNCAFDDVRYLWTDASYTADPNAGAPAWGWIGASGDTYIIRDGPWRVGQSGPNSGDYFGLAGAPGASGAPPPISGTSSQHTRIFGENYASCHSQSARTQLHGGYGTGNVLSLNGSSYVDVACLDITDYSACGRSGQTTGCNTSYPLSDYATNGIGWSRTSTNDTLTDIRVHGLASAGMSGPTGDGVVMSYVDIVGNASSGWNADAGDGTTGTGSLLVQHFNISWNGCAEEYPIVDALPYGDCTDDNSGGYGDGFGTATVASSPGWAAHFDQGTVSYNTQDGLDALHLTGSGSSMTITRVKAYGNMGQQIKVGGQAGSATNNIITTNCNAMRFAIPGTPSGYNTKLGDFCRAADAGVVVSGQDGATVTFQFNTIYSASSVAVEVPCSGCTTTALIHFDDNIFVGFLNSTANGYPSGIATNDYSDPIYLDSTNLFANTGSTMTNNITYHPKSSWTCPASGYLDETNALCVDPKLTDETWHNYGFANMTPTSSSPAIGAGVTISGITTDFSGVTRPNPPTIGAYEPSAPPASPSVILYPGVTLYPGVVMQ